VLLKNFRIRRPVYAVDLVIRDVTMEPLDLRPQVTKNPQRSTRGVLQLFWSHLPRPWDLALDDKLRHSDIVTCPPGGLSYCRKAPFTSGRIVHSDNGRLFGASFGHYSREVPIVELVSIGALCSVESGLGRRKCCLARLPDDGPGGIPHAVRQLIETGYETVRQQSAGDVHFEHFV
jgi:hypothetical protein